ncbi:hypothetical protein BKA62DRAFT_460565 [Auriculariales sp. MPI-PUGE-AT-0066]|nr:hypothetical protein BKA62DRAFT_460565 [Auriculariales sp. MPI-PUGE-AT-0066]
MASTPSEPPATKVAKEPFAPPSLAEDAKPPTTTFAHLTADEQAKHERIREWLSADEYKLDDKPLDEAERFWLSEECIQRYVRASKGVEQTAKTRLEATLRWRREYVFGTELMNPESFSVEGETGKQIIFGYDHARRPALYLLPSRQNTDGPPQQIRYSVSCSRARSDS